MCTTLLKFVLFLLITTATADITDPILPEYIGELVPLEAPENLTLVDLDGKDVTLKWEAVKPESVRGTFRGYLVRIWNNGASQVYAIPPDVTKTSVQFFPFSKNFITVSVRNDKYVGPRSNAISFDAPQTEPNYPFLFEWHQLGNASIFLQWNKPTQPNGVLLGYNIYCSETNDFAIDEKTTFHSFIDDPDTYQTKITGLKKGKKYQVNISAVNCAGESEHNSLDVELQEHSPYMMPSIPFFRYKINYKNSGGPQDLKAKCAEASHPQAPNYNGNFDDFGDDYYILNDTNIGKIVTPKELTHKDVCLVNCLIIWIPDVDNNPGESFYVKYRMKGEKEFLKTHSEMEKDHIILENFNSCKNYEIILVAVDGKFETESELQETPAINFMRKY